MKISFVCLVVLLIANSVESIGVTGPGVDMFMSSLILGDPPFSNNARLGTSVAHIPNNPISPFPFNLVVGSPNFRAPNRGSFIFIHLGEDLETFQAQSFDTVSPSFPTTISGSGWGDSVCVLPENSVSPNFEFIFGQPSLNMVFAFSIDSNLNIMAQANITTPNFGRALFCAGIMGPDLQQRVLIGSNEIAGGVTHLESLLISSPTDLAFQSGEAVRNTDQFNVSPAPTNFGQSMATIGDPDGNGSIDFVVGDPDWNGFGSIFFFLTRTNITVLSWSSISSGEIPSINPGSRFGQSIANIGDLDGDGFIDIAVGAPGFDAFGAVFILFLDNVQNARQVSIIGSAFFPTTETTLNDIEFGTSITTTFFSTGIIPTSIVVGMPGLNFDMGGVARLELFLCGNGITEAVEQCDSGLVNVPGCTECVIDPGYSCTGFPSVCVPICGDNIIVGAEECDDGNAINGDGCSSSCSVETGFGCTSQCTALCGDGLVLGNEICDDNNTVSGDGCSEFCFSESDQQVLSGGGIAGIVLGVIFGLCLIAIFVVAAIFFLFKRNQEPTKVHLLQMDASIPVLKDVVIGKQIGSGAGGIVYFGEWQNTEVACKTLKTEDIAEFENELKILSEGRHPAIITFFGIYEYKNTFLMVTEFMNRGDLSSLLIKDYELTTQDLAEFCYSISTGMRYLHDKEVIHRDLACRNVLVHRDDEKYIAKVSDFGLSKQVENYYTVSSKIPVRWTAPEVTMWEIFSRGVIPYSGMSNEAVIDQVQKGHRLSPPPDTPLFIAEIMKECWQDANERPTFVELVPKLDKLKSSSIEYETTVGRSSRSESTVAPSSSARLSAYYTLPKAHLEKMQREELLNYILKMQSSLQ